MAALISIARVPSLDEDEGRLLSELATRGMGLSSVFGTPLCPMAEVAAAKEFVFRRWVLESLLLLDESPLGYGALSRRLSRPPAQSLVDKLKDLERAGLLRRRQLETTAKRVEYQLTAPGSDLARCVFALTTLHAERVRYALRPQDVRIPVPAWGAETRPHVALEADAATFLETVRRFKTLRLSHTTSIGAENGLVTARRFAEMCVKRWHGDVMHALLLGPLRFGELRERLRVGNEALTRALRQLSELRAVEKNADQRYVLQPLGRYALALGGPIILLTWRALRTKAETAPRGANQRRSQDAAEISAT